MMHHYTNRKGYNSIRAKQPWHFRARKPRGRHPVGAYFTTLPPDAPKLTKRLRISKSKTKYVFVFTDIGDLTPLSGDRGQYVYYSPRDYDVDQSRQRHEGPT
jgi:hypothetical protein